MDHRVSSLESLSIWQASSLSPILLSLPWSLWLTATTLRMKPSSSAKPVYPVGSWLSLYHYCFSIQMLWPFFPWKGILSLLRTRDFSVVWPPALIMRPWLSICLLCFRIWLRSHLFRSISGCPVYSRCYQESRIYPEDLDDSTMSLLTHWCVY